MQRKMKKKATNHKRIIIHLIFLIILLALAGSFGYEFNQRVNEEIINLKDIEIEALEKRVELLKNDSKRDIELTKKQHSEQINELNDQLGRSGFVDFAPKLKTIRDFIKKDNTNELKYKDFDFNCVDFTQRLINNLLKEKIYACYTYIEFNDGGHAIVAVNTSDKGVIYIEPQTDRIIYSLEVGEDYCDVVNWNCNWDIIKKVSCFD